MSRISGFIGELRRRGVVRALVFWGVAAFAVLQVYEPVMHGLHLPEWTLSFVVVALGLGFPVTAGLAWTFDLTWSGVERTLPAGAAEGAAPAGEGAPPAPLRLALLLVGVGVGAALPGMIYYFVWPGPGRRAEAPAATAAPSPAAATSSARPQAAPTVAVLPFVNMSSDKEQDYFSDGISEEILNALSQVDGLRVIGRTSSFAMKGQDEDVRTVGQRLGAGTLLEGSVRKAGSRVRITAQLVEAAGGSNLWSQQFDRQLDDVFAVQAEIAQAVVAALRLKLLPASSPARSVDPAAHDLYLRGLALYARGSGESAELAAQALQGAVDREPGFAPAWAALARARFMSADQGSADPDRETPRAFAAAERALALAPDDAAGYLARGFLRMNVSQDWAGARADLQRARELNPGSSDILVYQGRLLAGLGRLPEAAAALGQAVALDPLSEVAHRMLAVVQLGQGRYDQAQASAARALELAPENAQAARSLGFALLLQHRLPEARTAFHRSTSRLFSHMGDAMVDHAMGHAAASQRALDEVLVDPTARRNGNFQIAQIFAWRGEADRAFEWLDRAVETHDAGLAYLKHDPILAGIRPDPRFRALLERLKLPAD